MMVDLLVAVDFKPGKDVIEEGAEGDRMYIVAGGRLHVFCMNLSLKRAYRRLK